MKQVAGVQAQFAGEQAGRGSSRAKQGRRRAARRGWAIAGSVVAARGGGRDHGRGHRRRLAGRRRPLAREAHSSPRSARWARCGSAGGRGDGARGRSDTRRGAAGRYRVERDWAGRRRDQLRHQRADAVPHPRAPDDLRERRGRQVPAAIGIPGASRSRTPAGPFIGQRELLLLAAHARRRRDRAHRVACPAHLHARRVLRRVGPAARA